MFIAVLFTIVRDGNNLSCSSMDEWIKKMWYIYTHIYVCVCVCIYIYTHTIEYHSAIKENEILPLVTT